MGNIFYQNKTLKRKNLELNVDSPVSKRFRSTFDYLYQKLFIGGEGSDVTINAFDHSWKLHKLYICQSPFFESMFSGSWLEKDLKEINLEFADSNITADSLHIIFGSFYFDSLKLKEDNIVSVIAACIWFQLEELRNICEEFVIESLNFTNVVQFYELSRLYQMPKLSEKCLEWLSCVLLQIDDCKEFFETLHSISLQLMLRIILNPRLFVIQIEQDVFLLLLKWLYVRIFPNMEISLSNFNEIVCNYFKSENPNISAIDEAPDDIYKLFEAIRWEHMISTSKTASVLDKFSIIPKEILMSVYKNQWINMLKSNETNSVGPDNDLGEEIFWKYSERCGRVILKDVNTTWRWSTYKYDMDIVVRYTNREFYVIRFVDQHNFFNFVRHTPKKRQLKLHFTVASYRNEKYGSITNFPVIENHIHSGLLSLELLENIPVKVLSLPGSFQFPLILSANFLRCNPACSNMSKNDVDTVQNRVFDNSTDRIISM